MRGTSRRGRWPAAWGSRVAASLVLAVVAGGCGDTADGDSVQAGPGPGQQAPNGVETTAAPTDPAPTVDARPADGPAPLPATPLDAVGLEIPPGCPTPWPPLYGETEDNYPSPDPSTARRQALLASAELRYGSADGWDADTDGDGAPDRLLESVEDGTAFGLHRSDGDLVLAVPGGSVGAPGGRSRAGDLDGDGRDEVLVYVADGTNGSYPLHVVPGAVPAGRHNPRVVGTRLPFDTTALVLPVDDLDGDGRDDLAMPGADGGFLIVGGATVLAAAGGALPAGAPAHRFPGAPVAVLPLGDPARPVPLVQANPGAKELTLHTEPPVVLAVGVDEEVPTDMTGIDVRLLEGDDGRLLQLATPGNRDGGSFVAVWNLDAPCAAPVP